MFYSTGLRRSDFGGFGESQGFVDKSGLMKESTLPDKFPCL